MKNYYNDHEIDFILEALDNLIKDYRDKIDILVSLQEEFVIELKARRV